jgi:hypothetical protein
MARCLHNVLVWSDLPLGTIHAMSAAMARRIRGFGRLSPDEERTMNKRNLILAVALSIAAVAGAQAQTAFDSIADADNYDAEMARSPFTSSAAVVAFHPVADAENHDPEGARSAATSRVAVISFHPIADADILEPSWKSADDGSDGDYAKRPTN